MQLADVPLRCDCDEECLECDAHHALCCVTAAEEEEAGEAGDADKQQQWHDEAEAGKEDAVTSTASVA